MARIRTYDRKVKEAPLPGVRFTANASPDSFGAGQARAVGEVGEALGGIADFIYAEDMKLKKAEARDAVTQAEREADGYLNSIYQRQGKDATGAFDESQGTLEEIKKKYGQDLKNQLAKDLFNSSFDNYVTINSKRVLTHQSNQITEYKNQTLDAENKQLEDNAILNRNDIKQIRENERDIIANTRERFKGFEGAATQKAIEDRVHSLYNKVLEVKETEDPQGALEFLNENLDKFNPKIRADLKANLQEKADIKWVNDTAFKLANSSLPIDDQLEQIDKIKNKDPELLGKLRKDVKSRWGFKEKVQAGKIKQQYENEVDTLMKDPVNYKIPLELSAEQQTKLYNFRKKLREDMLAESGVGEKTKTDPYYYDDLVSMSPRQLAKIELDFTKLSPFDRKKFIDARADARKGNGIKLTQIQSDNQLVTNVLKDIGKGDNEKAKKQLSDKFQYEVSDFEMKKGGKATPTEKIEILDRLVLKGDIRGTGFFENDDYYYYELDAEQREDFYIEDIPKDDRVQILEALKAKGVELTEENVVNLYTRVKLNE